MQPRTIFHELSIPSVGLHRDVFLWKLHLSPTVSGTLFTGVVSPVSRVAHGVGLVSIAEPGSVYPARCSLVIGEERGVSQIDGGGGAGIFDRCGHQAVRPIDRNGGSLSSVRSSSWGFRHSLLSLERDFRHDVRLMGGGVSGSGGGPWRKEILLSTSVGGHRRVEARLKLLSI